MAIIKKYDSNYIYISERLKHRMESVLDAPLTIMEAPAGYGKTTTLKEFLKNKNVDYIWFNVDSKDKDKFFEDFTLRISTISEEAAHKIAEIGFPTSEKDAKKITQALWNIHFRERCYFVVDNYQLIADKYFDFIVRDFCGNDYNKLSLICLTQAIKSKDTLQYVVLKKLNYLGKEDFELTRAEIYDYFKLSGIKLEEDELDFLYKYTEGWISALFLQMLSYVSTNKFEPTVSIDSLVSKAIWENLSAKERDFLVNMSVFDSFSIRQAVYIYDGKMSEREVEDLVERCGFINYDSKTRKYYIHALLRYFLDNEFFKLEAVFKKKIYKTAGDWCKDNEQYLDAIKFYYINKDYDAILDMNYTADIFNDVSINSNKQMVLDIIAKTPTASKKAHINTYMVYIFFLFKYNKRDLMAAQLEDLAIILKEDKSMSAVDKNVAWGNYYILEGVQAFNNIDLMREKYEKAYEYLKAPTYVFSASGSSTYGCPSVLSLYHKEPGKLSEEIDKMTEFMPVYYKLTDGNGKGQDSVFKAEALFMQGNFKDAEKLCNKAIYMADTSNEVGIYICAMFLLARISLFVSDYEKVNEYITAIRTRNEDDEKFELMRMADMCDGYINLLLHESKNIPGWLTKNDTIEENGFIQNLGFDYLIYSEYLLETEQYAAYEAVSGAILNLAGVFNNVMYRIYNLIFLAVTKLAGNNNEKARQFLEEAIELAEPDKLYIPFVEHYDQLAYILSDMSINFRYREFATEVKKLSKKYLINKKSVANASRIDHNYGLTNRELDVAKLAAQRLSNKEIAEKLFIAESTVKSNMKVIFNKLNINSRNELKNYFPG